MNRFQTCKGVIPPLKFQETYIENQKSKPCHYESTKINRMYLDHMNQCVKKVKLAIMKQVKSYNS